MSTLLICRTPLRVSFFGGGTDYPIWYEEQGGAVISTTINKYSFITLRTLPQIFDYKYKLRYFSTETVNEISQIQHPSVRESARMLQISKSFEMVHTADLPAGTGLGSSSTFTVGMLHAFHAFSNYMPSKRELATEALMVEQDLNSEAVGSQDQIAAAWGGFNHIMFSTNRTFEVNPITISQEKLIEFQNSLLLCFTGFARSAQSVALHQIKSTPNKFDELQEIAKLTAEALNILNSKDTSINEIGKLLNETWRIKKNLTPHISNPSIENICEIAMRNGALGAKLLGAGGGGFLLFFAEPQFHGKIRKALDQLVFVDFRFENTGSKIIYFSHE